MGVVFVVTPSKLVRLVVGFSRGSASDDIANTIRAPFAHALSREVTVELRPGRNGADAACEVAAGPADGSTLFVATLGTHALAPHLDAHLPYHPLTSFTPVTLLTRSPLVLACHPSLHVDSVKALVELARARPGELTYGTSAIGGAPHLAAELFCALAGVRMRHVRYDDTRRLYEDLEAGRIALSFNNIMSLLPRCADGAVRALAVTGGQRSSVAPDLPTLAECGVPQYELSNWLGLVAPRGTPSGIVDEMRNAAVSALADPDVRRTLEAAGVVASGSTPEAFEQLIAHELARWKPIVETFREEK